MSQLAAVGFSFIKHHRTPSEPVTTQLSAELSVTGVTWRFGDREGFDRLSMVMRILSPLWLNACHFPVVNSVGRGINFSAVTEAVG